MDYASFVDDLNAALAAAVTDDVLRGSDRVAVVVTGDVESTLALWLATRIRDRRGDVDRLAAVFVDHGHHFGETRGFVETVADAWNVDVVVARNADAAEAGGPGQGVAVDDLAETNRNALRSAGIDREHVRLDPLSEAGRLLLRTVPLRAVVADGGYDAAITGARADGPEDRGDGGYVVRWSASETSVVHPLRHMTEHDVWRTAMEADLPVNPVYGKGYREARSVAHADEPSELPAWQQVLGPVDARRDASDESAEGPSLMERLRDAGDPS